MSSLLVSSHITLNLSRPNSGVVVYAKQFDKDSRIIDINLINGSEVWDPPTNTEMVVMYAKPDGTKGVYDQLEDNSTPAIVKLGEGHIQLTLAEQALTAAGNVFVEISFYTAALRSTTLSFILAVESGVPKNEDLMSDDYFNILSELIQGLLGATVNPPQIDPITKNWMLWNQTLNRYEVSEYSSIGTKGDKGDQGWSIVSVTKTGGTGAGGTVDTYTMRNNNPDTSQQVVGTFNVYNGSDGEGAPGAATPLIDSGTGVVGTAVAYSREDHQHPLNVSDDSTTDIGSSSPGEASTYARSDHSHGYGELIDLIYPVGSIYMSVIEADPSMMFGGEWEPLDEGRVLIGANESYPIGSTGGSATVTLTTDQIPSHTHGYKELTGYAKFRTTAAAGGRTFAGLGGIFSETYQDSSASYPTIELYGSDNNSKNSQRLNVNASHTHNEVGGDQPHDNMPPYLAVYMWKRIA